MLKPTIEFAEEIVRIASQASEEILAVYNEPIEVENKEDASPLTMADQRAHASITAALKKLTPDIPIISEEQKNLPYEIRQTWTDCWMVDPLDGTKEFIKRNGEFTVNIALIHQGEVVLGVVYLPVSQTAYFAVKNCGAFKQVEQETSLLNGGVPLAQDLDELLHADWHGKSLKIVASRSHLNTETQEFIDQLINNHAEVEIVSKGSSLKFCMIAEHEADIYPRYAPTMEWDTAAAHIIATESGKKVIDTTTNQAPRYNKESLRNNEFVVF